MKEPEKFFSNRECRYFPCHEGVEEAEFNCLFCYCPLYFTGEECGGDFVMKDGVKSCINCKRPHIAGNFEEISKELKSFIERNRVT